MAELQQDADVKPLYSPLNQITPSNAGDLKVLCTYDTGQYTGFNTGLLEVEGAVFIGNAGGDIKGVKGRMYALGAQTGKIVWEFYLVPRGPGDHYRPVQSASMSARAAKAATRRA